jgi:hypothetical protein
MESELDERLLYAVSAILLAQQSRLVPPYLFVHVEFPEDLSGVEQVLVIEDPYKQSDKPWSRYGSGILGQLTSSRSMPKAVG